MYNLLIALGLSLAVFAGVGALLSPIAGVVPALLTLGIALFLLTRRISRILEAEMQSIAPMLQTGDVKGATMHLERIRARYGRWQFLLHSQIEAQLGMLDYLRLKWDEALPKLERGKFRNWQAHVCIGAIHHRQGRADEAWPRFESAAGIAPKEAVIYLVWAVLLTRSGERNKALTVLDKGLKTLPDSEHLARLQKAVANKRKLDTRKFPDSWLQFFPEDMLKGQRMRGRRDGLAPGFQLQQPRPGARNAPRR